MSADCQEKRIYVTAINSGGQVGAIVHPTLFERRDGKIEVSQVGLISKTGMSHILKPDDGILIE